MILNNILQCCALTSTIGFTEDITYPYLGLRLVGGSWKGEGRVEIFHRGRWGTVCDDDWDINDARVVCRALGYPGAASAPRRAYFGRGSGVIWLDNVRCLGNEMSLERCRHNGWGNHNCRHDEDASAICSSKVTVQVDILLLLFTGCRLTIRTPDPCYVTSINPIQSERTRVCLQGPCF